jgi:phage baseplate assembly protein W
MATILDRPKLYGVDLALRDGAGGADLSLVGPVGLYGDIALATGNDDIVQALALRLRVRVGELALLGWPDYGSRLHELIGEPDLPRTRLKAQAFARAAIEADPRVAKVDAVEMDVHLITEPQPLNLVFDLALSGTEALP